MFNYLENYNLEREMIGDMFDFSLVMNESAGLPTNDESKLALNGGLHVESKSLPSEFELAALEKALKDQELVSADNTISEELSSIYDRTAFSPYEAAEYDQKIKSILDNGGSLPTYFDGYNTFLVARLPIYEGWPELEEEIFGTKFENPLLDQDLSSPSVDYDFPFFEENFFDDLELDLDWFSFLPNSHEKVEFAAEIDRDLFDSIYSSGAVYTDMDVINAVATDLFSEGVNDCDGVDSPFNEEEEGIVMSFKDSVVSIYGLKGVKANELIYFSGGASGIALNLEYSIVKALIFSDLDEVKTGEIVSRSHSVMRIGVGFGLLGRVINPLGSPIDGFGPLTSDSFEPIERKAPGVITRKRIGQPLETGLKVVDSLVPIGRGQRELVLGDRKTGKTTIIIDSILNQRESMSKMRDSVICVYVAVGKRMSEMLKIRKLFASRRVSLFTTCVFSRSSDPAALQFIAPYVACTIAEYFTYKGYSAFISYDDLSRHADAYREISLLLRRPVGREAYPGDIFYVHSRLLERAVKLSIQFKLGSLTALPVIETIQGDVASYIPTNVISITDGQIYLSLNKHQEGARPAVDPGLSVSRVGSSAQARMMRRLASTLKLELAQYREVEQFSKFTSELDDATLQLLEKGVYVSALLQQERNKPFSTFTQAAMLHWSNSYFFFKFSSIPEFDTAHYCSDFIFFLKTHISLSPFRVAFENSSFDEDEFDIITLIHFKYYYENNFMVGFDSEGKSLNNPPSSITKVVPLIFYMYTSEYKNVIDRCSKEVQNLILIDLGVGLVPSITK